MKHACLRRIVATAFSLTLVAVCARTASADGLLYSYTKIQFPASLWSDVSGLNNAGRVVGSFLDAGGKFHGYLYDGTTYAAIDFPGAIETYAFGIDASGRITGSYANVTGGPYHGFVQDAAAFTSFDFPSGETDAQASNSAGQIVGIYDLSAGAPVHGYVKNGAQYTSIDVQGASDTGAYGINDAGLVSGVYKKLGSSALHGFAFSAGTYFPIDLPGAAETFIGGLNNQNRFAGWSRQGQNAHGLVVWDNRFRSFDVSFPGVTSTKARAINDAGQVLGIYTSPDCPGGCGFLAVPQAGVAPCDQVVTMTYTGGTLTLKDTLSTATPATYATWLFYQNTSAQLWSIPVPAVSGVPVVYSIPGVPPLGKITMLSMLTTTSGVTVCADLALVDTGGTP